MTVVRTAGFLGANLALHPSLLPEGVGVSSVNQKPGRGDLRPWKSPLTVATVPAGRKTVYRMGKDAVSDTTYWLSWTTLVHVVRGFIADDTAERTYYSGSGAPKWTDTLKALTSTPYPTSSRELGVPAPTTALLIGASGGVSAVTETRVYTYTHVTDIGEESAPAPASTLLTCKLDAAVTIGGLGTVPSGNYGISKIRIYRTQTGTSGGTEYFFLRELASTATSSTDDNRTLGEVLGTVKWIMPPADLKNLTGLWNGMMAGISGRSVRFCHPFTPYAWPIAYDVVPPESTPVALGTFGQTLVVLTNDRPLMVVGGSPDAMDEQPIDFLHSCVSAQSVVSMGSGVVWASPDGLCFVGQNGPRVLTAGLMTRDDWQALVPSTIVGGQYEGRYIGFYTVAGVTSGFVLDPMNPSGLYFLSVTAEAVYFDEYQDALYLFNAGSIQKWDAGSALTATVKTKHFRMPKPTPSLAVAQVVADTYPVSFKLYADGLLKHTQTVASAEPFFLPSGYHFSYAQFELATAGQILYMAAAHSIPELAQT